MADLRQQQVDNQNQRMINPLFKPENGTKAALFEPLQQATSSNAAANRALQEQYLNTEAQDFEERFNFYKTNGLVMDAVTERIMELDQESHIAAIISDPNVPLESKIEAIRFEMNRLPYRKLSPYDELLFQQMRVDGGGMVPLDNFNKTYQETSAADLQTLSEITRTRQLRKGNQIVNEVAAAHGWTTFGDMAGEVAVQDFIPVWNVLTRLGLGNLLADRSEGQAGTGSQLIISTGDEPLRVIGILVIGNSQLSAGV